MVKVTNVSERVHQPFYASPRRLHGGWEQPMLLRLFNLLGVEYCNDGPRYWELRKTMLGKVVSLRSNASKLFPVVLTLTVKNERLEATAENSDDEQ